VEKHLVDHVMKVDEFAADKFNPKLLSGGGFSLAESSASRAVPHDGASLFGSAAGSIGFRGDPPKPPGHSSGLFGFEGISSEAKAESSISGSGGGLFGSASSSMKVKASKPRMINASKMSMAEPPAMMSAAPMLNMA